MHDTHAAVECRVDRRSVARATACDARALQRGWGASSNSRLKSCAGGFRRDCTSRALVRTRASFRKWFVVVKRCGGAYQRILRRALRARALVVLRLCRARGTFSLE